MPFSPNPAFPQPSCLTGDVTAELPCPSSLQPSPVSPWMSDFTIELFLLNKTSLPHHIPNLGFLWCWIGGDNLWLIPVQLCLLLKSFVYLSPNGLFGFLDMSMSLQSIFCFQSLSLKTLSIPQAQNTHLTWSLLWFYNWKFPHHLTHHCTLELYIMHLYH